MEKIIFLTSAYNAEKTITRTIKSIFSQTCDNWVWYIINNGSTDKTGDIINKYAMKDSRIIMLSNKQNHIWEKGNNVIEFTAGYDGETTFICNIDADDEYKPDFLTKMLAFVEKENLDIAVCGNDFIDAISNRLMSVRKLSENLIIENDGFDIHFPVYHQFIRAQWAKLIKLSVCRKCDLNRIPKVLYGADTLGIMESCRNASRIGIINESLHKYYVNSQSTSYKWDDKRIISDQILHDTAINFLIDKAGYVSAENKEFLFCVYYYAINDTLKVLNAQISSNEKLTGLHEIFTASQTRELAGFSFNTYRYIRIAIDKLFEEVSNSIISNKESRKEENLDKIADIYSVLCIIPKTYNNWSKLEIFKLTIKTYEKSESPNYKKLLQMKILEIASEQPFLNGFRVDFLVFFYDITLSVIDKKFNDALEMIVAIIDEEQEIPEGTGIQLTTLGLILSSQLEKMEYFIFFKKLQVTLLIETGNTDKATRELADWDEVLPNDKDFKELRMRLT